MISTHLKFALVVSSLIILLAAWPVQAGFVRHIMPCGWDVDYDGDIDECQFCHLWQLASNIVNFVTFNLALTVAPILFVVAGVLFLTSGGSEERLKKARAIFLNTIIGLVIIFCSWLLVDTIIKTVAGRDEESGLKLRAAWSEFPSCSIPSVP